MFRDQDPQGTQEWLDALDAVIEYEGSDKAHYLIQKIIDRARGRGLDQPYSANTEYVNTIPLEEEPTPNIDYALERRIRSLIRWNAIAMVLRANKRSPGIGGHLASFASSATMYEVGFNHFYKGGDNPDSNGGDMVFFQGHSSPGVYARAFLEGRLSEAQLENFRQEVGGNGLSSYPHPWLMPGFWQFPTVSMGLGPLMAIYQARFMRYLQHRGLIRDENRHVWAYLGDGEMDEPESLGAIGLATREKLDNLIFVVNCNLQRLDGPVRGNGKIIQELEGIFRGAGWNVIKVLWGEGWDSLLARDTKGLLQKRMMEVVDGDYQTYRARDGAYIRENFFGAYPELKELVRHMTDDEIYHLTRGGHSPRKMYAAYKKATENNGKPTVILAKTIKGYGMGEDGESANKAHQQKNMGVESLRKFRDRFNIPLKDEELEGLPFYRPPEDSPEIQYLKNRRAELGGVLPKREDTIAPPLTIPPLSAFSAMLEASGERAFSSTMALVRFMGILLRDKNIKQHIVPIIPDEARTFGMEGLFRQIGIYAPEGQKYTPEDAEQMLWYKESNQGQVLEEGINEAGAMSSWIAAATSYVNHRTFTIPFYVYYSMFGYQRVGDLVWAAGDMQARGFLIGATSGRTTLEGEGLQHQDGHHHLMFGHVPNAVTYDPTFAYELAVILQDGLRRMYQDNENVFYYISVMNENYTHPEMPKGAEDGIVRGLYCMEDAKNQKSADVHLMGSGSILTEAIKAKALLKDDFGITAAIWSATSFNQLRRDAEDYERACRLAPDASGKKAPALPYVRECLDGITAPIIAATDYVKAYAEQIRPWVRNAPFTALGTDGYGRSDNRQNLREFFEVSATWIAATALYELHNLGKVDAATLKKAYKRYRINANKPNPRKV